MKKKQKKPIKVFCSCCGAKGKVVKKRYYENIYAHIYDKKKINEFGYQGDIVSDCIHIVGKKAFYYEMEKYECNCTYY